MSDKQHGRVRWRFAVLSTLVAVAFTGYWFTNRKPPLVIPEGGGVSDWPAYGRVPGGARYAPLTQITPDNVIHLEQAWVYRTGEDYTNTSRAGSAAFECTPLLVDGRLYIVTQSTRVIALDPESGEELWTFDPEVNVDHTSELTSRGLASWRNGEDGPWHILVATLDARLIALDATTGVPIDDFGDNGTVELKKDVGDIDEGNYLVTSPPAIVNDVVVVGSAIGDNQRVDAERGVVRGFDVRTGTQLWSWDPIPRSPEDPGYDHWQPEHAATTGGGNAWSILSADEERDLVFVPTGSASPDYYGGERLGDNLYANCVVALQASTGKIIWHFQVVHHDLWDYDVPSQPTLCIVHKDGEEIDAVAQATKMGHLFFLNRDTGEPIFPVEERPVPASDVSGEVAWPTQPFPVVTPPLVPQDLALNEVFGLTPWDKGAARKKVESLRRDGLFTPPSEQGSLHYPGVAGGSNWGSIAFDANRKLVVLNTSRVPFAITLRPRPLYENEGRIDNVERAPQAGTPFGMHREPLLSPLGLPVNPPPWGTLVAVSTETGEILWNSILGTIRDLAPLPIPIKWGTPTQGGPIITESGLVFISATMDYYLRAFNVETGEELWKGRLPAGGQATPMTYRLSETGKQYVAICAGGHGKMGTKLGDHVVAYALPDSN